MTDAIHDNECVLLQFFRPFEVLTGLLDKQLRRVTLAEPFAERFAQLLFSVLFVALAQLLAPCSSIILTVDDLRESDLEVELFSDKSHDDCSVRFSAT